VDPASGIRRTGFFNSSFDEEALRRLSQAGAGRWLSAPTAEALTEAFAYIHDRELVVIRTGTGTASQPRHVPFLLIALGLLAGLRFIRLFFLGALV
jgi:hypothetical protein